MIPNDSVRPVDPTGYFTYQNPDLYHCDWKTFYDSSLTDREQVRALFPHEENVKYGPDPYQILNVYYREDLTACPVIVYFHGGRWREGHPAFYDHLAAPWVERGAVFVSCGYRLAPEHTIADAADDASTAINWVAANCETYGGDPQRLFAAGHSAGGHIAAMATLTDWPSARGLGSVSVAGLLAMSAPCDLAAFGEPDCEEMSPNRLITRTPPAVLVSFGDPEPNHKQQSGSLLTEHGRLLVESLERAGASPTTVVLYGTDHIDTATAFADLTSPLFHEASRIIFDKGATRRPDSDIKTYLHPGPA